MKRQFNSFITFLLSLLVPFLGDAKSNENVPKQTILAPPIKEAQKVEEDEKVSIVENPIVGDYINRYNFYYFERNGNYLVADAIDESVFVNNIVEVKVIFNTSSYSFGKFDYLKEEKSVIEFIKLKNGDLEKFFYLPSANELENLILKSKLLLPDDPNYSRVISSATMEFSYKKESVSIMPLSYAYLTQDLDNQAPLDHYLETMNQEQEAIYLGYVNGSTPQRTFSSDDGITNLIPKNYFMSDGLYTNSGSEWGYLVNTKTDSGNNKVSSVLIYDIFNLRADLIDLEIINIKTVLTYNFKYDSDTNIVFKDIPNNYCLGNPQMESYIKDYYFEDNRNKEELSGSDDKDYKTNNELGFCFGSYSADYIGVSKKYFNNQEAAIKLGLFIGNFIISSITGGMSLVGDLAVSASLELFNDAVISIVNDISNEEEEIPESNSRVRKTIDCKLGYGSIEAIQRYLNYLPKYTKMNVSDTHNNSEILFKSSSDSINYKYQIFGGINNKYTALLGHKFKADVFNDNTFWLNNDFQKIGSVSSSWAHYIGQDIKANDIELTKGELKTAVAFGVNSSQDVYFTPKISGAYDILLHDMPSNTVLEFWGYKDNSGLKYYTDSLEQKRAMANKKYLKHYVGLNAGERYKISIYRNVNGFKAFGTATLKIYYCSDDAMNSTGSSQFGRNYSYKYINFNNYQVNSMFRPETSGLYTFTANPYDDTATGIDTYLMVLDENHKIIMKDDDRFAKRRAGIKLYLVGGKPYFVVSRLYNFESTGQYEVEVYKQNYLPDIKDKLKRRGVQIGPFNDSARTYDFLTSQSVGKQVKLYLTWSNSIVNYSLRISLKVYNPVLNILASTDNLIDKPFTFTFEKDVLYLLEFSSNVSSDSNFKLYFD